MGNGKYLDVANWIQEQVASGELQPGSKIYSEHELSSMFQLSRQTIRHAVGLLEEKGVVVRVKGSGTYINSILGNQLSERKRVAVITTYVDSYIFPKTIQGIEAELSKNGYAVQISFTNNMVERERRILKELIEKNDVSGIILEPIKSALPNPNMDLYQKLKILHIPILCINSYYKELNLPHVSLNDVLVAKKATNYLIQAGHKKIGAILKSDDGQGHLRYCGYFQAMKEAGLQIQDVSIIWVDTYDMKNLRDMKQYIIGRLSSCTACFCYNDQVAFDLIELLKEEKLRVPDNLSVVGIDGSDLAMQGEVKITTFPHPMERLGEVAARNLIQMTKNPIFDGTYEFDSEICEHNSVRTIL